MQRIESIKDMLLIGKTLIIDRGGQDKEIIKIRNSEQTRALVEFLKEFKIEMRVSIVW